MQDLEFIQIVFIQHPNQFKMNKLRKLILEALDPPKKIGCSCGCNTCDKAPILNESKKYDYAISVNMRYHIDTKTPIHDSILPKPEYNKLINEAKVLVKKDIIKLQGEDLKLINESSFEKLYKIEGLLVTNKQVLTQSQVLSDIRAVSGVTIVSNKEYNPQSPKKNYEYNYTTVKIDPSPYVKLNGKFDIEDIKGIIEKINNLKGVVKYKAEPKLINIGI